MVQWMGVGCQCRESLGLQSEFAIICARHRSIPMIALSHVSKQHSLGLTPWCCASVTLGTVSKRGNGYRVQRLALPCGRRL